MASMSPFIEHIADPSKQIFVIYIIHRTAAIVVTKGIITYAVMRHEMFVH